MKSELEETKAALQKAKEVLKNLLELTSLPNFIENYGSEWNSKIAAAQGHATSFLEEQGEEVKYKDYINIDNKLVEIPEGWELLNDGDEVFIDCKFYSYGRKWENVDGDEGLFNKRFYRPMIRKIED